MSEMSPEMINPMARPKIMAPAASRMARIVARMFSVAFVVSCYDLRRSENKFAPLVGAMFGTGRVKRRQIPAAHRHKLRREPAMAVDPGADFGG